MITKFDVINYIKEHDLLIPDAKSCYFFGDSIQFAIDEKNIKITMLQSNYLDGGERLLYHGEIELNKFILYNRKLKLEKLNYDSI